LTDSGGVQVENSSGPFFYHWYQPGGGGTFLLADFNGRLCRLDGLTNAVLITRFEQRNLMSLREDLNGNIWVGLESHGLHRVRRKQIRTISTPDGLPIDDVTTILADQRGRMWLGTFGKGLYASADRMDTFLPVDIPGVANVTALFERADGTLSLGTYHGDHYRGDGTNFVIDQQGHGGRATFEDREGGFWVGTLTHGVEHYRDGRLTRYTARDGLASDRIQCLAQDAGGDVWVGTLRGLNRISSGRVVGFSGEDIFARKTIRALYVDPRGALWVGTLGSGLARISQGQASFITAHHGLPSDGIEQIVEDDATNLWLGTWTGIARINREELESCAEGRRSFVTPMTLGQEDGMITPGCGSGFQPSCTKTRSGTLWFCTPGGLVVVDPKLIKPRTQPPPVHIEEASADDRPLALGTKSVTVPPGVRRVSFRYTALSFSAPEKIRFRYRLEGYDDAWVSAGGSREATYTRLPAGNYRFRVSAGNKDGVWNTTGAVLGVMVVPPWWQAWWFRGLALTTLGGLVFGAYELRIHQHKKARGAQEILARRLIESQEQERKRVAAELHDSLGQSLQVIKGRAQLGLNRPADSSERAKQFEEISTAASQAIQEVRTISHALRPAELDQLGLAKAIEWIVEKTNATSATRFACELDRVDGLAPEIEISLYRIAQEGINNVLKHANATEAILQLRRAGGAVCFSIFDNGRGLARPARHDGHGLFGIAERARLFGGRFEVHSAPGKGTRLTVTIPV
jgi:signal transduction histidine kinase